MNSVKTIKQQQGAVLVLTALCLFVLMGAAGLAIDIGHTLVNKTIEQNAADAMALSAAIRLNQQNDSTTSTDEQAAAAFGLQTYDLFKQSPGNAEISSGLANNTFTFTFSKTNDLSNNPTWQTAPPAVDANFVRVTSAAMPVNAWFAGVVGFPQMAVSSSAVAGFTPITPCDVAPVMMCADVDNSGNIKDVNCNDNTNDKAITLNGVDVIDKDCYGYEINALYCMKQQEGVWSNDPLCPQPPTGSYGAGNFGFLDYDPPGFNPSLKYCTAGEPACALNCRFSTDPSTGLPVVATKTGQNFGPVSDGFNTRFNLYGGGLQPTDYPPDLVIGSGTNGDVSKVQLIGSETELTDIYSIYSTHAPDITTNLSLGKKNRRILPIPFVNCGTPANPITLNGNSTVKILGFGCFMMAREFGNSTQPYVYSGDDNTAIDPNKKFLYGVFVGDDVCQGVGQNNSVSDFGFDKVILYKDPSGGHS
jgi:Flp pilus assembly protein TadG